MQKNQFSSRLLQPMVAIIAGVCLLTSCSSVFNFQKRKYTRGVYHSTAGNRQKTEERTLTAKKSYVNTEKEAVAEKQVDNDNTLMATADKGKIVPENLSSPLSKSRSKLDDTRTQSTDQITAFDQPVKLIKSAIKKQHDYSSAKKGVVGTLFKIILVCVLICLAVAIIIIVNLTK